MDTTCYNPQMPVLGILLILSSIVWSASLVFLIYAIGMAILFFNIPILLAAVILVVFANIAQFTLGVLND